MSDLNSTPNTNPNKPFAWLDDKPYVQPGAERVADDDQVYAQRYNIYEYDDGSHQMSSRFRRGKLILHPDKWELRFGGKEYRFFHPYYAHGMRIIPADQRQCLVFVDTAYNQFIFKVEESAYVVANSFSVPMHRAIIEGMVARRKVGKVSLRWRIRLIVVIVGTAAAVAWRMHWFHLHL